MKLSPEWGEKQEWVRRVRDLPYRRAIRLELTPAGEAKLAETLGPSGATIDRMFANISRSELENKSAAQRLSIVRKLRPYVFVIVTERLVWQRGQNALFAFAALANALLLWIEHRLHRRV